MKNQIILSNEEKQKMEEIEQDNQIILGDLRLEKSSDKYTPRMLASKSLFPNHHIYPFVVDKEKLQSQVEELKNLISKTTTKEQDILSFFREPDNLKLLSCLFNGFDFGHHEQYIFREFPLPNGDYRADFLLVGKGSSGYHEIFVEFESPYSNRSSKVFTEKFREGHILRKGRDQLQDWETSLEKFFSAHQANLMKYMNPDKDVPKDFLENNPRRRQYILVAGKRSDFEVNYNTRIQIEKTNNIKIMHYDRLVDEIQHIITGKSTWY